MDERINIAIAEDQILFRDSLAAVLKGFNIHTVAKASNGRELIELLEEITPDLILLDIEMPLLDGSRTLDFLMVKEPQVKIIILSQYSSGLIKQNFLSRGARAFLTKDVAIEELARKIREVHALNGAEEHRADYTVFTKREIQIIPMICNGQSTKEISKALRLDVKTVEAYRRKIYRKTRATCVGSFVRNAVESGLHYIKNS